MLHRPSLHRFLVLIFLGLAHTLAWCASSPDSTHAPFVHPGMLQSRQDLELMKRKVAAGEQPWKDAWDRLRAQAGSSLDFQPRPFTHIFRGGFGWGSSGGQELSSSAAAAYSHALQWYVTGEKAHAQKAIAILNAWTPVLWDFDGNDAKLLAGWTGHALCNAAEILRSTDSGWSTKDVEQFKRLMLTVYYPLIKDFFPEANGNWDAAMIDTMLCIGIFCDDRAIFDHAVEHYRRGGGNGGMTRYIYPDGQCEESTRDQGHVQLGLGEFAQACQVAWTQGVDLYGEADNRLALGFEYTARYMLGEAVPCRGVISDDGRGRFSDIYEAVWQHYHFVKGQEMPNTRRALEQTRSRDRSWSALTFYRGPRTEASAPASLAALLPDTRAAQAGALTSATAQAPADATLLKPGADIQAVLDIRARAGGGWVVLAKGLHTLPAPLRFPSGVTLAGQGKETILMLDPNLNTDRARATILAATDNLHDVVLRDFTIEGAATPRVPKDPNSERQQRAVHGALSRAGIRLLAARDGQMRNIKLEHVTVHRCTHQGVSIKGAAQLNIIACDFTDNGGTVVPGPGQQHNLQLSHVGEARIDACRLDDSLWGSGLDLTFSRDVTIENCETARNEQSGIRVAESQNVRIQGCLAEGNNAAGIAIEKWMDGCRDLKEQGNLSRNNGAK